MTAENFVLSGHSICGIARCDPFSFHLQKRSDQTKMRSSGWERHFAPWRDRQVAELQDFDASAQIAIQQKQTLRQLPFAHVLAIPLLQPRIVGKWRYRRHDSVVL